MGTVYASTVKDAGMKTKREFKLTEFEAPTRIRWAEVSKNLVTASEGGYDLAREGEGTRVTIHNVLEGHGAGKLLAPLALRSARKGADAFGQSIKAAVEAAVPAALAAQHRLEALDAPGEIALVGRGVAARARVAPGGGPLPRVLLVLALWIVLCGALGHRCRYLPARKSSPHEASGPQGHMGSQGIASRSPILYDLHGNLPALEAVLADAEAAGAERYLLGGDYALFGAWPLETVERLRGLDARWIRGNVDRWLVDEHDAPDAVLPAIDALPRAARRRGGLRAGRASAGRERRRCAVRSRLAAVGHAELPPGAGGRRTRS